MTVNELVQFVKDISEYREFDGRHYCQECFQKVQDKLRQQHAEIEKWTDQYQRLNENLEMWKAGHFKQQAEIEALKQIIDANNLSQNIGQFVKPDLKIEEVMSEHCTCYKLGYSPLNDYASVKQK